MCVLTVCETCSLSCMKLKSLSGPQLTEMNEIGFSDSHLEFSSVFFLTQDAFPDTTITIYLCLGPVIEIRWFVVLSGQF